jgi:hypothetical protein
MGRKPVLGLVGACLASVALVGCDNQNLLQRGGNKDVTATNSNSNNGWKNTPKVSQTGAPGAGASGAAGTSGTAGPGAPAWGGNGGTGSAVANTGGSFNVNQHGPVGDYPEGRSMPSQAGASGGVERVGYSSTPGPDVSGGRTTLPPVTPATMGSDTGTGGRPPVVKPLPTGGVAGGVPFDNSHPTPPSTSTLPPLTPPGPAHPRTDDIPSAPTSHAPVVVPTSGRPTSGAPDVSGTAPLPPPPVGSADSGSSTDLPPIPPPPPVSPSTKALQTPPLSAGGAGNPPPLPSASAPTGTGVPTPATKNPASFQ